MRKFLIRLASLEIPPRAVYLWATWQPTYLDPISTGECLFELHYNIFINLRVMMVIR